jgi:putative flippase GtrA
MIGQELSRPNISPVPDSLDFSSLGFERILNTYVWTGDVKKEIYGPLWDVDVHQRIRSRLIKTDQTAIQDEYQGIIALRARLLEEWNVQIKDSSNVLADNRAIDLGRMAQHQILAGADYVPTGNIAGEAMGGYELNSQEEENDHGFAYELGFNARQVELEEFNASLQSSWNQSFLGRRSPNTGDIKLSLLRNFGAGIDDSLSLNYSTQRRQYYTSIDSSSQLTLGVQHNIFQRDANLLEISNQTIYNLDRSLSIIVSIGISNQLINRGYRFKDYLHPASLILDSRIQELQFFGIISMQWLPLNWLVADIKLMYTEKEERHSVMDDMYASNAVIDTQRASASRLENTAQRTTLTMALKADVSQEDRMRLVSSSSILHYDTPDIFNTDDRDELLLTSGAEYVHRFSSRLLLMVNADLTLFHLVYLDRNQSANNNWNRVVRFSPSVEYMPASSFRTVMRTEVLANYTISDYEQQVSSIRSFSFRQVLWSDSTSVRVSERIHCNISGSLRIFERGTLRWQEFTENPEDYVIEKTMWPEIIWSSAIGLNIGIGFRYFGQDRYIYQSGQRAFSQGIEAMGPTASIEWLGLAGEKVTVNGWREEQKSNGTTAAILSNLSIQVAFVL